MKQAIPIGNVVNSHRKLFGCARGDAIEPWPSTAGQTDVESRVVSAAGNMCDSRLLRVFHRRCHHTLDSGPASVVVDLAGVTQANTRLVATLVAVLRRARAASVSLELIVSGVVHDWITICNVERFLRPIVSATACTNP